MHASLPPGREQLRLSQAIMAVGLAFAFNGMVGAIVLEVVNSGALKRPFYVFTFAGYFSDCAAFRGEAGAAFLGHFLSTRENSTPTFSGWAFSLASRPPIRGSSGLRVPGEKPYLRACPAATGRAGEILGLQIRQQVFTLGNYRYFSAGRLFHGVCLVVIACMAPVPNAISPSRSAHRKEFEMRPTMMRCKTCKTILYLCVLGLLVAFRGAGGQNKAPMPLTLSQVIDLSLKQNRDIQLAQLAVV